MTKADLLSFIRNQCDDQRQREIIHWINETPENKIYYHKIKAEYIASFSDLKLSDSGFEFRKFKSRISRKSIPFLRIAAVLLLLLISGAYLYFGSESIFSPVNSDAFIAKTTQQKEVELPDGTTVILNSESKLTVADDFNTQNRIVFLEGEAFFSVTENKDRPFIVKTLNGIDVKVLGTKFNVRSYDTDETVETTLVSGKVEVYENNTTLPVATLKPHEKAIFHKEHKSLVVTTVETRPITSWSRGELDFENTPIKVVLKDIERWYDVAFNIEDQEIESYTLSGKFKRENTIKEVLEVLEASSPIKYEYNESQKLITLSISN
ncbi:FecR family protein [Robertkochia solimangrovi]|uniref:FecR family protein n=1 Tax=Robertkochia solimangrovi TaxID=2213046 RepID=UPI0013A5B089|nr:FecR domain-containing protein [Robertkochia solimangrovi]